MITDNGQPQYSDPKLKDEEDLAAEIRARFRTAKGHYEKWDEAAKEDYKFALGDQWTVEEREKLQSQRRPCLTFNRIRPLINLVSGYQRENSARIKVSPEGGEDRIFSEVMDRGIKAIDKWSHMSYKMGYWFDDGCYCGRAFLEAILQYERDPIRGEIDFKLRSPYQIKVDPDCMEYDVNEGANYLFKIVRLSKRRIKELYPEAKKLIAGFKIDSDDREANGDNYDGGPGDNPNIPTDDNYGADRMVRNYQSATNTPDEYNELEKDSKFTIKEYWYKKRVARWFVINKDDSTTEKFETEEDAQKFVDEQEFGKPIKRMVDEMWVAAYCCGFVLQNIKSPFEPHYSGFPFFRFLADWAPNAETEELRVQGITRPLKDPQKEKNKAKSQYLHITNTQANSGWIGDEDALSKTDWEQLEQMGSVPGITIKKKPGSELKEIQPKFPSQAHLARENAADEEFTQISGINPDLMGFQDGTTSGRAISMRIRQAVTSLVRIFYNYRYSKEIVGNFILAMVPALFDSGKLKRVLGPQYMRNAVDKEKYPEGLSEGHLKAFLTLVKDQRYDVYVAEADQNKTMRFEIFQDLTELMKAGAPIPIDLISEYMDLPNSQEVIERIKEAQAQQPPQEEKK